MIIVNLGFFNERTRILQIKEGSRKARRMKISLAIDMIRVGLLAIIYIFAGASGVFAGSGRAGSSRAAAASL